MSKENRPTPPMATVFRSPSSIEWIKRFVIGVFCWLNQACDLHTVNQGLVLEKSPGYRGSAELMFTVYQSGPKRSTPVSLAR
jgi:hypothetical protein